mgnify:FL=1
MADPNIIAAALKAKEQPLSSYLFEASPQAVVPTVPGQVPLSQAQLDIQPEQGYQYGNILPFRRQLDPATGQPVGDMELTWPTVAREFGTGLIDLVRGPQTGNVTPEALTTLMDMGLTSALSRPRPDVVSMGGNAPKATGNPGVISTRLPTAVRATEDPVAESLTIGLKELESNPKIFTHNVGLLRRYPNVPANISRSPGAASEQFIGQAKDNLIWLHNRVPEATRARSKLWYDGGRRIIDDWKEEYGFPDTSIAGVLAALSPQKDWYQNVDLARRLLDISTQRQSHAFDDAMEYQMHKLFDGPRFQDYRGLMAGKRYQDLDTPEKKAFWLRLYDEAYNDRSHKIVSPEGEFGEVVLKGDGTPRKTAWGSLVEIRKAVGSLESDGDRALLTALMGGKHKVRNFYNNLLDPNNPRGDVTIDTHAVAAAQLRPLSGTSAEVHHNFGSTPMKSKQPKGWQGTKNSAISGVQGTYGIYAEAYRRAAQELGLQPRQLQSITWEAARGLFPDNFKNAKNNEAIDAIWRRFRKGEIRIDEARNAVEQRAGGINPPTWE